MPHFYSTFPPHLQDWCLAQPLFFTGSAPTTGKHINLSPKGLTSTTFTVFDENHAAYLDATGSGAETIAHIYDNGRVTIMFCSFTTKPRILRLYCTGRVVESVDPKFKDIVQRMGMEGDGLVQGVRAVILLDIWKVQTSCGYAVPTSQNPDVGGEVASSKTQSQTEKPTKATSYLDEAFQDRDTLTKWIANKVQKDALTDYQIEHNSRSLDGFPGLRNARRMKGEFLLVGDIRAWLAKEVAHPMALFLGFVIGVLFVTFMARRV